MDYYFSIGNIKCKINNCIKTEIEKLDVFKIAPCDEDINYYLHNFDGELYKKITENAPISHNIRKSIYKYKENYANVLIYPEGKIYFSVISPKITNRVDIYIDFEKWNDTALYNLLFFEFILLQYNAFLLHSSVVSTKYGGIIFSAPSQTGKSTQADLWKKYENANIINGDKGIYRKIDDAWWVYGCPWAGTSGIVKSDFVGLKAAFIISQGKGNIIKRMSPARVFSSIISQTFLPFWDKSFADAGIKVVEEFIREVPVYSFECTPDKDAVKAVKELLLTM